MPASTLLGTYDPPAWAGPTVEPVMAKTSSAEQKFGTYLSELSAAAGFTQSELARISGVNQTQLSRAFDGVTVPTIPTLRKLAPHLGVDLIDLVVAANILTPAEARRTGALPTPGPQLPAVLRSILSRLANPRYRDRHKQVLLEFIQDDVDKWDGFMEQIEEERAEARRGGRR